MTRTKRAAVAGLAIALAATPVASAWAGGYGPHYRYRNHYGHGHYYNPLYPVAGLAAAVVGTAAAIVTLPFAILGAAAQAPAYYPPPPAPRNYYPPQGSVAPAPGYGSGAYYPAPAASAAYAPPPQYSYPPRASYDAARYPQYGDFDNDRGPAANNGYYRQDVPPAGGYYVPRSGPYGAPYADSYSYGSPNQR